MTRGARGPTASAMATDRTPPKPQGAQDIKAEREAKLAEALRANLRRRKAESARGPAGKPRDGESG